MKDKIRNRTFKRIILGVLFCIFTISIIRQYITMNKIQQEIIQKQKQVDKLKDENDKLKNEVKESTSDDFIEKQARERLNMIKPGEKVVVQKK